ncbi:MAG: hypothetical protein WBG38_10570, partial [Nodosilinea sp.]
MTPVPSALSTRPDASSDDSTLRLRRAIESLNLSLDDELYRYRQQRSGQGAVATPRLQLRTNRKPIDLIALKTATGNTGAATSSGFSGSQQGAAGASVSNSQVHPSKTAVTQVRLSHGGTLTTYRSAPEEYLESTEALLDTQPNPARPSSEQPPSLMQQLTSPLGIGALLLLLVGSAGLGYLVTSPQAASHLSNSPIARRFRSEPAPV